MPDPSIPPGLSRETTIRRTADGRWFHDGEPVTHEAVARAFDRWIGRAPDGRYMLENDVNWAYVQIEGAPLFVRSAIVTDEGVDLVLSDTTTERLVPGTLRQDREGRLYCDVRGGDFVAQFTRKATLQLEPLVGEDADGLYVEIGSGRVRPAVVDEPLDPAAPRP